MADGKITIKVTVDGKEIDIAAVSLGEMEGAAKGAGKETGRAGKDFEDAGKKAGKFDSGLGKVIKSLGLVAIGAAAFKVLTKYMGAAVDRFDKLQTFPKVLEQLGASSEDAERQMGRLSDGIEGLPTSLDEIAASAQQMYLIFRNADKATDSALALNNALLASGTAGGEASTGAEMYMKTLQKGKVTLLDWQNMTTRMGVAINEVADSMGLTIDQLKTGLMDGSISVNEFNDELIKLGTGTGKLAQVALTTSEGIRTSFQNLGTAVTKGLADIITGVDNLLRDVTGKGIAQHFDSLKHVIRAAFNAIKTIIEGLAPVIRFVADAFKFLVDAAKPLEPVLIGIAAAFVAYKVVTLYGLSIQKAATLTVSFIRNLITATTTTNLFAAAQAALQVVMKALQGPLGWITLGIGALAAAMAVVIKRVKASAQKFKEYRKEIKDINETLDNLRDGVEGTNRSYDDQKKAVEINIRANRDSIRSLNELMGVEEKSAGHKKLILDEVNKLNDAIPDLNLAYDEQRDRLNMSTDVMDKYLTVAQRESELNIVREKGIELEEKRAEAGTNLERLTEIHKELNEEIIEGSNYAQYQHIKALNE
ncbi:MAG: tape measure protein, partial [Actinomycetaceae bacterium]|nr:tape measure protein [Actinomycetaceae bacterium]